MRALSTGKVTEKVDSNGMLGKIACNTVGKKNYADGEIRNNRNRERDIVAAQVEASLTLHDHKGAGVVQWVGVCLTCG